MADSINSNNPAVDGMGRSYAGIDLDMLKNLMSGKVGDAKPFNSKGTDEIKDELQKLAQLLGAKNAGFVKELQKAVKYIDEMKKVLSSISTKVGSKEEKTNFGDMANALGKVLAPLVKQGSTSSISENIRKAIITSNSELKVGFKSMERSSNYLGRLFQEFIHLMEPLVDEGLKKGSIYVQDSRLSAKIGRGLKIEKGSLQKISKSIFKGDEVNKSFADALEMQGIKPEYQHLMVKALQEAAIKTKTEGLSDADALTKAFKEVAKDEGLTGATKKEFLAKRLELFDAAKEIQDQQKKARNDLLVEPIKKAAGYIGSAAASFTKEMTNVDFTFTGIVQKSKELYKTQVEFQRSLYQTMGAAGNLAESQAVLNDLAYSYAETGVDTIEAYKMATKYQKAGIKLEKDTSRIIKGQLATEKQIGLEAGSLGDYFMDMKQSTGMTGIEVRQLGLDMSNVAKSSGLSGDAMKSVVEKSKDLAKQLQSMGTMTVESNKNSLSILAEAKKLGVDDQAATLMKGMSGMNAAMKSEYNKIIMAAGRASGTVTDIMAGTIMDDPAKLGKFAQGMKELNDQAFGNVDNKGRRLEEKYQVKKYEDLRRLTMMARQGDEFAKKRLTAINAQAQNFGTTAEAMLKLPEVMLAGTKSTEEKLEAIKNDKTKTEAQRTKLKAQIEQEATSTLLSKLGESVTYSTGSMDDAVKAFQKEAGGELDRVGGDAAGVLKKSLEDTNKRLVAAGEKPLKLDKAALDRALGDKGQMQEVIATLQEGQALAASAEQAMNNPVDQSARSLKKIEDYLTGAGASVFQKIAYWASIIGGIVMPIAGIATAVGSILTYITTAKLAKTLSQTTNLPSPTTAPPPSAPAPPPREGKPLAPAPPPNIDEKGKTKGAKGTQPPQEKAKAEDAASKPKGKTSAKAVGAEPGKTPLAGKKPVTPKGKVPSAKGKGKLGAVMSGGSALAGGLAETALDVIGGGGDDGGCACSIAESALSKVSGIAGIATDVAMTAGEAALDATKKTGKAAANAADDAAKGAMKGAAKATAKGVAGSVDDAAIAATKSAGVMSKATGFLGKTAGVLGKVAGPLASVAGAGIEIAAGGDVTEAISGGAGGLIGGALLGTVGTFIGGPLGTAVGGAIGAYAGDWLGRIGSEYLPGVWDGVKNVSSNIWEGTKNVGSWLYDTAGSVGSTLYDGAANIGGKLLDGAGKVGGAIADTASAAMTKVGDAAGWVGDKVSGAASAVGSTISSAASSVGSGISAGWSSFTGWLGFNEGAREIENSGLAMLHKGEVIFPKSIVETLISKGTSSFGSLGGYLQDVGGGLASAASNFVESGGIGGMLGSAVTKLGSSLSNVASNIFGSPSKMQGEMASAEIQTGASKASTLATAGSAALNSIANATESQTSISNEIKSVLKEILNEMVKANNTASSGDTEPYVGMSSSRDAFKSPIGNINDVAVKNVQQVAYG